MADLQGLLSALDVFSRAPDRDALEKANSWLQDFQHSVTTLSPVDRRLDLTTPNVRPRPSLKLGTVAVYS